MKNYFAGFIMTYERSHLLGETIQKIMDQTVPPEKLLIVDNSLTLQTKSLIDSIHDHRIHYYHVGYNAGPAGAACIGLKLLSDEGYEWIYWGDDDDPPKRADCFELLLSGIVNLKNPGIVGAVGHRLNRPSMQIERTPDNLIHSSKWLEVDVISGGMCMIVNSQVVKRGVQPDVAMFYGFEELDFCMRVKNAGFSMFAMSELFVYYRAHSKRPLINAGKRGLMKNPNSLWREYYSTRNILYIVRKNDLTLQQFLFIIKSFIKCLYGFRFGIKYGFYYAKYILLGITDFLKTKMGQRIFS